jgi:hypothetical protein
MSEIFNDLDYDRDIAPSKNKFGFSGMNEGQAAYVKAKSNQLLGAERQRTFDLDNQLLKNRAADLAYEQGLMRIEADKKRVRDELESNAAMDRIFGDYDAVIQNKNLTADQQLAEMGRLNMLNAEILSRSSFGAAFIQGAQQTIQAKLKKQADEDTLQRQLDREQRAADRKQEDTFPASYAAAQVASSEEDILAIEAAQPDTPQGRAVSRLARIMGNRNIALRTGKDTSEKDAAIANKASRANQLEILNSFDSEIDRLQTGISGIEIDGETTLDSMVGTTDGSMLKNMRGRKIRTGLGENDFVEIPADAEQYGILSAILDAKNKLLKAKSDLLLSSMAPTKKIPKPNLKNVGGGLGK